MFWDVLNVILNIILIFACGVGAGLALASWFFLRSIQKPLDNLSKDIAASIKE
jgi:hypothetical protein